MKKYLLAIAISLLLPKLSAATTFGTDFSDLWFNPNESGWGVNVVQQNETLFLTFFIYGVDGKPVWYVAPSTAFQSQSTATGALIFAGPLYSTTGPWFGGVFNPANVNVKQVGNVTWSGNTITAVTLVYTVDGVSVNKTLERQTWRVNNLTGAYLGAANYVASGCVPAINNGNTLVSGDILLTTTATTLTMITNEPQTNCTYVGSYSQAGRMGSSNGNYTCTNGVRGIYQLFEMEANSTGITARLFAQSNVCSSFLGKFGALRK
jgi:hypothetical protein